ncbi:unnamed protein product [Cochlearia groenlandica]
MKGEEGRGGDGFLTSDEGAYQGVEVLQTSGCSRWRTDLFARSRSETCLLAATPPSSSSLIMAWDSFANSLALDLVITPSGILGIFSAFGAQVLGVFSVSSSRVLDIFLSGGRVLGNVLSFTSSSDESVTIASALGARVSPILGSMDS